jgi:V-ATPase subunit H
MELGDSLQITPTVDWHKSSNAINNSLATPAMGDIYSEFIDELLSNIRARPLSWEAQERSGMIDDSQVKLVKTIDKSRRDKRIEVVSKVCLR